MPIARSCPMPYNQGSFTSRKEVLMSGMRGKYLWSLLGLLALSSPSPGQALHSYDPDGIERGKGRYPLVPFDSKDVEALFKSQLEGAKELDMARKLLDQILKNKDRLILPKGLDLNDPALLERMKPLVKDLQIEKAFGKLTQEEQLQLYDRLKDLVPKDFSPDKLPLPPLDKSSGPPLSEGKIPVGGPDPAKEKKPSWLSEEKMKQMVGDWMEGTDHSHFGDWLRESPAWKNTLSELQKQLQGLDVELPSKWSLDLNGGLLEGGWDKINSLPTPSLPSVNLPSLGFRGIRGPGLGGPGGGPSGSTLQVILWSVLAVVVLAVAWYAFRNLRARHAVPPPLNLGPWPVDPSQIATRTQLRLAFDYLALLHLGPEAHTWNHRRIGAALAIDPGPRQQAARALAALYELARYTPGPEELGPQETVAARTHLALLT